MRRLVRDIVVSGDEFAVRMGRILIWMTLLGIPRKFHGVRLVQSLLSNPLEFSPTKIRLLPI